jgi:dTMP kinase
MAQPISHRGKLIAIEGIDGSGKQTQVRLLASELESRGHQVLSTGFPQYGSWFGKMVGQFLNGDFGPLDCVEPRFTAMLYAGDRFECRQPIAAALESGGIVLTDRYVASNLAHQTARSAPEKREEFRAWIEHLEYGIYGLPKEDLVLYLRVPPREAQTLVAKKSARTYTESAHDILESDIRHLQDAADRYDVLAQGPNWKTIECYDVAKQSVRPPREISAEILAAVLPCVRIEQEAL